MKQSQPLRIENGEVGSFGTARCMNSKLWFINNSSLEHRILGYLARYKEKYETKLYAFVIMGNHFHPVKQFPELNRASFYRDLNARVAEAVRDQVYGFPGGKLFERRYSEQALPRNEDIEDMFFYCALQPVIAGLVKNLKHYPGYNSFYDAISGKSREFKVVDWAKFHATKRWKKSAEVKDFTTTYTLKYDRLPGYEQLTQEEYKKLMLSKLRKRKLKIIRERKRSGKGFLNKGILEKQSPGSSPYDSKKSERYSLRPLVLCSCPLTKQVYLSEYFAIFETFKKCVADFVSGKNTHFPIGTYQPPGPLQKKKKKKLH